MSIDEIKKRLVFFGENSPGCADPSPGFVRSLIVDTASTFPDEIKNLLLGDDACYVFVAYGAQDEVHAAYTNHKFKGPPDLIGLPDQIGTFGKERATYLIQCVIAVTWQNSEQAAANPNGDGNRWVSAFWQKFPVRD